MRALSENLNTLIVEENPADQFLLEQLASSKFKIGKIFSVPTVKQAKEILESSDINIVLLDLSLPDSFGIDSITSIHSLIQRTPVIILTGLADGGVPLEALRKQNAQDYVVKSELNTNLLIKSIEYSIERKKAEEKIIASEEKYRQMFHKNSFPMWINDENTLQILEVKDAANVTAWRLC
ncbi:MAG TPA: response regulator [Flavisolibacter sp.]|jgi:DNA-binding NtrC family response regulator|nr:response regulator [Flavisolibacter sp.]